MDDDGDDRDVEIDFTNGDVEIDFDAELEDQTLDVDTDLEGPAADGSYTYPVGDAGTVTVDVSGMDVTLAETSLADGWEVTERGSGGEVELDIVNAASSTSRRTCHALPLLSGEASSLRDRGGPSVNFADSNLLFLLFLFLHIGSAIVAFGPTFAFPIIGAMGGREPQFANFAMRVNEAISSKLVGPLAIVAGLTGLGLIWTSGRDVLREPWLLLSIVLYVIALLIAVLVTGPASNRLIEATSTPLPPRDPAAGAPGGPPAHIAADLKRIQAAGAALTILTVVILLLMVFKPRF